MKDEIKEHMRNCINREESCLLNSDNTKSLLDYISILEEENETLKEKCEAIDKAKAKLQTMFNNGNDEVLDDLLELDKILGDEDNGI